MSKVLLVLDNAPGNPHDLGLTHPNIQGEYQSNTTTSCLDLLHQEIIIYKIK
jgi:hypothetical protein